MKKLVTVAAALCCIAVLSLGMGSALADGTQNPDALFVEKTGIRFTAGEPNADVAVKFTAEVASAEKDVLADLGGQVRLNGKTVSELAASNAGITMKFKQVSAYGTGYCLVVSVPESSKLLKKDNTDTLKIDKGFTAGTTGYVTTVDLRYNLGEANGSGTRIFRSDDEGDYETVSLLSIGAPNTSNGNMVFSIYFDKAITSRKVVNMQFRSKNQFMGLMLDEFPFSQSEIDLYYNYGMISVDQPDSLLYKIEYGCPEFNNSVDYNTKQALPVAGTVGDVQTYAVEAIQRKTDYLGPKTQQPLVVQIHMSANMLEFALKGDSNPEEYDGINYNLRPASDQVMVFRFRAGLLFPNGCMLKEDVVFQYDPASKTWSDLSKPSQSGAADDTLNNQGGYTDDEIAAMKKA